MKVLQKTRYEAGFTIIELTIATLVFSTILIVITSAVLSYTKSYYRGINVSATQNTTRNIVDIIGQSIQFSSDSNVITPGGFGPGGSTYFCAGGRQFVFIKGQQYNPSSGLSYGMYSIPVSSGCASPPAITPAGSTQLLSKGMRVTDFSLIKSGSSRLYMLHLRIASGDDDLLTALTGSNVQCKSQNGSQFCAVSGVQTVVQGRLQ